MHDTHAIQILTAAAAQAGTPDERRAVVARSVSFWCRQWYEADGNWISPGPPPDTRKTLWLCFGLLAGGPTETALANAILERTGFAHHHSVRTEAEGRANFDIFITNHAVQMLVQHGERLTPTVRGKLEAWGRAALDDYPGSRQADYQFHGFNDNMPAKATLGLILGGEYFSDAEAVAHGLWNLRQLRDLLTRRGLVSEYTSPTYLPNTLVNLTEIAVHARDAEARELAAQCAERLWADLLGHYHRPTGTLGGPFSRAYQLDSTGHFSTAGCLLWLALGDEAALHPIEEIHREPIGIVHHHDDRATQLGILGWIASCPAQAPASLLAWLDRRAYPFRLHASAERGGTECGEVNTTFHAEADFALGTSEGDCWTSHQAEAFFLQYRRRAPMAGIERLRTGYLRMLRDGQRPGDREEDHYLKPHGSVHTLQHGRVALVLARPALKADEPVESLKLSMIFPTHFGKLDSVERRGNHVFLRDGPLYLALRPLNATDWGGAPRGDIALEEVPNYQLVSFYNYRGAARRFSDAEQARTLNGLVAIVGLASEEPFEAFAARVEEADLLDYLAFDMRTVTYRLGDLSLGMSYAPESGRVRYATIDRRPVPRPLWEADGLPAERLPFLGTVPAAPRPAFPYRHLNVIWGDLPWTIASTSGAPA